MLTNLFTHRPLTYLWLSLILLAACTDDPATDSELSVSSPPSVSGNESSETSTIVTLSSTQARELKVETVEVKTAPIRFLVRAPGVVYAAPENISIVSAPISGRVSEIFAHEGERIQKGDPLLELESLEYANLLADFLENTAEAVYLKQQLERNRQLVEKEISAQRTLDRAEADYSRARTKVLASEARLKALGITSEQLSEWQQDDTEPDATLTIYSAITGVINEHLIDLGTSVSPNQKMLDIINNEKVLVRGFVSPDDASLIIPNTPVVISQRTENNNGISGKQIEATVTTINPSLDAMNRAIPVNSIIYTQNGWPIIGQNIRNEYRVTLPEPGISIPLSAVQFEQNGATVFIELDEFRYRKQPVSLTRITSDMVVVSEGLQDGDRVAINQVFSLKALGKFDEFAD